ncbi:uncharacterized protein DC041_0004739, partial [Schistosoma bovis]
MAEHFKELRAVVPDGLAPEVFKDGELDVIPSGWSQSLIAGFIPGRGCIDHIFTIRQVLEHRHTYRCPTIVVFLDLKAAFDSEYREVLCQCLSLKVVPEKYLNIVKALYSNTSRIRAYSELSLDFATSSGIDLLPGGPPINLEYTDNIILFGEDAARLAFASLRHLWRRRDILLDSLMNIWNSKQLTNVKTVLLYGAETWRTTITIIKNRTNQLPVEEEIMKRSWIWIGHTLSLTWSPEGKIAQDR